MTQEVLHTNIGVKARRRIAPGKYYVLQQAATPLYHSHHKTDFFITYAGE
jgi:hypothetical protein